MSQEQHHGQDATAPEQPAHPSQAEGEDRELSSPQTDAPMQAHPSQAEGEDDGRDEG